MRNPKRLRRGQAGAVMVTVAFALLFILGFMGIALDFGHLFVVKSELQTATDSCALAAAQELNGASDALTRAASAGRTAGNLNRVNFQGGTVGLVAADITFSDSLIGAYSSTFSPVANARYAKCVHTRGGMAPWMLQAMSAFSGNAAYRANQAVFAQAVAVLASSQTNCAIPVQISPKAGGTAPNYGFAPGEWIPSIYNEGVNNTAPTPGHFGWANLDGSTSATVLKAELLGTGICDVRTGQTVNTTGAKVAASDEWNSRFGLYKNGAGSPNINSAPPDLTGYAYTATNWPSGRAAAADFLAKRVTFRSYGDTIDTVAAGNAITGLSLSTGAYKSANMGTYAAGANALATHGGNRRLVLAPFVVGSKVAAWACMLILHPIDGPNVTVYLEYVDNAADPSSPCSVAGLAGGASGPLVPTLVQ
jgi:Flp pilus assembly protein TadG